MAKLDPQVLAHLEWLGFVQPTGLVVSAPALVRAGAILDRRDAEGQRLMRACLAETPDGGDDGAPVIPDFAEFASRVLGWSFSPKGYAGTDDEPIPPELEVALPDYGETLRPDFAVRERDAADGAPPWQLLVTTLGRDRLRHGHARWWPPRGLGARTDGAPVARDGRPGRSAVQRTRAAIDLRSPRRKLGLA